MEGIRNIMRRLGISSYKTETYLSLLGIRKGTVQQIARHSHVPSCKLYESLKWLHENGFVTLISQNPLVYRANNPKSVLKHEIEGGRERLEGIEKEVDQIELNLPVAEKDIFQITNTRDAYFKKIKESVAGVESSIYYMAKHWRVDAELVRLLGEKSKKGVVIRSLGPVNEETLPKIKWLKKYVKMEVKNYDPKDAHFSVYDKSLVIIYLREGDRKSDYPAIWIKNEVLGEILHNYFETLWENTKA